MKRILMTMVCVAALAACATWLPSVRKQGYPEKGRLMRKTKRTKTEFFFGRDSGKVRRSYEGCCFGTASEYHENRSDEPHDLEPIPPQAAGGRGGISGRGAPGRARRRAPDGAGRGLCALCRGVYSQARIARLGEGIIEFVEEDK